MKKLSGLFVALCLAGLAQPSVLAQESNNALVPLPSLDDFTKGKDGWAFGLGAGIEYESAYEGSDEFGFELDPAGAVQWRKGDDIFYFAGEAIGWMAALWLATKATWVFLVSAADLVNKTMVLAQSWH